MQDRFDFTAFGIFLSPARFFTDHSVRRSKATEISRYDLPSLIIRLRVASSSGVHLTPLKFILASPPP